MHGHDAHVMPAGGADGSKKIMYKVCSVCEAILMRVYHVEAPILTTCLSGGVLPSPSKENHELGRAPLSLLPSS